MYNWQALIAAESTVQNIDLERRWNMALVFGMTNCALPMVGPNVIRAIIDRIRPAIYGRASQSYFRCVVSVLDIRLAVDVPRGRRDAERWAVEQRGAA
jgi:hypothetical protein